LDIRSKLTLVAAFALVPSAVEAQNPATQSLRGLFDVTRQYITATAEMLDEELYAFRPTEEVRSMGELLAHIANAQFSFCSAAAGEQSPSSENFEETRTTKAQIVAALEQGFSYCAGVFDGTTDAEGGNGVTFFGGQNTVFGVLAFNSAHNYEHYGNLVTYMRLNGITPPSSMQ
jgi:uncharacterized damage-inducible protein DinB